MVSDASGKVTKTYVEDLKDPVEFSPPARDLFFIVLRVEKARNWVALALFRDVPLNLRHSSAIGGVTRQPSKS